MSLQEAFADGSVARPDHPERVLGTDTDIACAVGAVPGSLLACDQLQRPQRESWLHRLPASGVPLAARQRHTLYRAHEALNGVPLIVDGWAARVIRFSDGRRQICRLSCPAT